MPESHHPLRLSTSSTVSSTDTGIAEEPTPSELARILEEKERALELAARLGQSLLQENKELQEKNDFLEESLSSNNEIVAQLKSELKQRRKLFHAIVDLEWEQREEEQQSEPKPRQEELQRLESHVRQLKGANEQLQTKTKQLEELKEAAERREQQRVSNLMGQLRAANLKIAQMQVQLSDKGRQCEAQAEEVGRLLKEIGQRKSREKMLWEGNDDLQFRLDEAMANHQQLRTEMEQLQEKHFELLVMLQETDDELRIHRQKTMAPPPPPRRTMSTDSLYESLASELEGADSGCYNTPMFSARYGPSPRWSSLSAGGNMADPNQPGCSTEYSTETAMAEHRIPSSSSNGLMEDGDSQQPFEVPSRALLEAVRCTFNDRRQFRRSREGDQQDEDETPILSENPTFMQQIDNQDADADAVNCESRLENGTPRHFQDKACSPIRFLSAEEDRLGIMTSAEEEGQKKEDYGQFGVTSSGSAVPTTSAEITIAPPSSPESVDSLEDYSPPRLGAPGRPGTRDLDFSIRRLSLRKEINARYQKYRQQRGLTPSKSSFYANQSQMVFQTFADPSKCPSKQFNFLSLPENGVTHKQSPACSRFTIRRVPVPRHLSAEWRQQGLNSSFLPSTPLLGCLSRSQERQSQRATKDIRKSKSCFRLHSTSGEIQSTGDTEPRLEKRDVDLQLTHGCLRNVTLLTAPRDRSRPSLLELHKWTQLTSTPRGNSPIKIGNVQQPAELGICNLAPSSVPNILSAGVIQRSCRSAGHFSSS